VGMVMTQQYITYKYKNKNNDVMGIFTSNKFFFLNNIKKSAIYIIISGIKKKLIRDVDKYGS
jgi:hypothetical protein